MRSPQGQSRPRPVPEDAQPVPFAAVPVTPNGWIKSVLGFKQFSLRGLHRVQAEWKLVCLALNLRRMGAMSAV